MQLRRTAPAPFVALEILVKKADGLWHSRGVYAAAQRRQALRTAKALETAAGVLAVRLIQDTWDHVDNLALGATLYRTDGLMVEDARAFLAVSDEIREIRTARAFGNAARRVSARLLKVLMSQPRWWRRRSDMSRGRGANPAMAPGPDNTSTAGLSPSLSAEAMAFRSMHWRTEKRVIDSFLRDCRPIVEKYNQRRDHYIRFGLCFFICGACEVLIKQSTRPPHETIQFVADCLGVMMMPPGRALRFAETCERYLVDSSRYMHMFQAGHNALIAFQREGVSSTSSLHAALATWNRHREAPEGDERRSLTLMFTDIVASSALAADHGDAFAMRVLRSHNHIVETVLNQFNGLFIKHTGDGILAAFDEACMAVKSACVIQRCVCHHTASFPSLPVHIRIGLNVGEALTESGDVFGSAVNLAHRVCAAADSDQILCTGIVRRRVACLGLTFIDRGQHRMKGFKEPVPVYELLWRDDATQLNPGAEACSAAGMGRELPAVASLAGR